MVGGAIPQCIFAEGGFRVCLKKFFKSQRCGGGKAGTLPLKSGSGGAADGLEAERLANQIVKTERKLT